MKAIVYKQYGSVDVLELKEVEKPLAKDHEILIKVHAAEVTKTDCEMRSFDFQVKWFWLPLRLAVGLFRPQRQILGGYFSGEVESAGKAVSRFKAGDQVFGTTKMRASAYGEYLCLPARSVLVTKPRNMSFAEAAAVPLGGLNALHFMRKANIQRGEKVLINGAGGSIGSFAVQIAKSMGAEVTAVDKTIKEDVIRRSGADHFVDYTRRDFAKSGKTYDVVFDMVANGSYSDCTKVLNPHGRYLLGNPRISDMLRSVLTTAFTDKVATFSFAGEQEKELIALKEMIEAGTITVIVDKVYSFEHVAEAHRRVEREQRLGAIVLAADHDSEKV